jgi:lipopolysaccharide transport system ATP-binding protein
MSAPAISVHGLSKLYRLGELGTGSLAHDLNRWWHRVRGREDPYSTIGRVNDRESTAQDDYVWALQDINFEVAQGRVFGIIGNNGAGKSTLLKILSRVTSPTRGEVRVRGRLASLLEVGTGFHGELTGRENLFLNGAILGMRRHEIAAKLDEIVDFSGVGAYLDTPVKRYSSGMYVRLAFAVAAHLEPEILVVDEVLAVGDVEFQKRCLGKMQNVAGSGRTVLFVSHNLAALRSLCHDGMVLRHGRMIGTGEINAMVDLYLQASRQTQPQVRWDDAAKAPGDELMRLRAVRVCHGQQADSAIRIDQPIHIEVEYDLLASHPHISTSIHLLTEGVCAFVAGSQSQAREPGRHLDRYLIPAHLLNACHYSLNVFLIASATQWRVMRNDVLAFEATEPARQGAYQGGIIGTVRPHIDCEHLTLNPTHPSP